MTQTIPDFTDAEHKLVSGIWFQRYGKLVSMQLANIPRRLPKIITRIITARL
jgi:hypothetical protein